MSEESFPVEVDVLTAAEELKNGATLLDVREPMELEFCKVNGSLAIPMGQISRQFSQIPKEGCLLIMCHHGFRSGQVTAFLRAQGYENAVNVAGGIDAWAQAVDTQMARY
ncbi:MAG: rhodanese-like domain-containing protein [Verrucomicrobia bacterium]|nr:rhodanese-like domain-containing protein [Verrucomicrobiota bacterium]